MRRTGFGVQYDYDDIPAERKVVSPDGKRAAAFWVSRERDDRRDDDTTYEIAVWDVASKREVESYTRLHKVDRASGEERGKAVTGVRFAPSGELEVVFADGSVEPAKPRADPVPPWERRKPGEPPPPLFTKPR